MLYLATGHGWFRARAAAGASGGRVWSYSSGTANILSRIAQDAAAPWARRIRMKSCSSPLGMSSATMEADEYGTLVASSYMYATARDWARYGLLLAQDGVWQGKEYSRAATSP